MVPSDERFDPDDLSRSRVALRLPVQDELVVFERPLNFDEGLGVFFEAMGHTLVVPCRSFRVIALDRQGSGHGVVADGANGDLASLHETGSDRRLESYATVC